MYWNLLNEKDEAYVVSPTHQQLINEMEMEKLSVSTLQNLNNGISGDNEKLKNALFQSQKKYQDLIKENKKLQEKVDQLEESSAFAGRRHNERGAGRKPDLEKKQKMANAIKELREQGKKEKEITEILGISRAAY